jgi:hypothetical protein
MIELLTRLGKTSAVVGENGILIALLALLGKYITPDQLIAIHSFIVLLKSTYLHYKASPDPNVEQKALDISSEVEDISATSARKIIAMSKANGGKVTSQQISNIIQNEFYSGLTNVVASALSKLSDLEREAIEKYYLNQK